MKDDEQNKIRFLTLEQFFCNSLQAVLVNLFRICSAALLSPNPISYLFDSFNLKNFKPKSGPLDEQSKS